MEPDILIQLADCTQTPGVPLLPEKSRAGTARVVTRRLPRFKVEMKDQHARKR
jgi:hypothetical protein